MRIKRTVTLATFLLALFAPAVSFASTGILDTVTTTLHGTIFGWAGQMQTATEGLFFALAGVEVAIMFMYHVVQKRGHEDLFTGIIKKTITLGFFLWLINNAVGGIGFMPSIINGLANGASAVGTPPATPSTIATEALDVGIGIVLSPMADYSNTGTNNSAEIATFQQEIMSNNLSGAATTAYNNFGQVSSSGKDNISMLGVNFKAIVIVLAEMIMMLFVGLIAGGGIFMLALDFLMVQLESYLVMVLGMVVLAGGGLRYTSKYVGSYIDYGISVGVRLFVISAISYLVVTVLFKDLMQTMALTEIFQMGFETAMLALIIAMLPKKAVSIAQTLLSGQSSFGGEGGKALAAGAGAAAVVATGGAALAAGAVAGGTMAGIRALQKAAGGALSAAKGASGAAGATSGGGSPAGTLGGAGSGGGEGASAGVPFPGFSGGSTGTGANGAGSLSGGPKGPSAAKTEPAVPAPKNAPGPSQGQGASQPATQAAKPSPSGSGQEPSQPANQAASDTPSLSNVDDAALATEGAALATDAVAGGTGSSSGTGAAPGTSASPAAASPSGSTGNTAAPGGVGRSSGSQPSVNSPASGKGPAAQVEAPAPLPPVSDAHGTPAPAPSDIQKALDQIAKNTAPKKSGASELFKKASTIKNAVEKKVTEHIPATGIAKGQGISTEHMKDFD